VLLAQLNPVNPSLRMQKVCNFAGSVAFPIFAWHWLAITVLDNVLSRLPESQVDAIGTFWPQYFLVMSLTLAFWKISSRFFEPVVKAKLDSFGNRYLKFARTPAAKI
jgi:peptidoglycan/LPS O-acetylase OafA/YrhL